MKIVYTIFIIGKRWGENADVFLGRKMEKVFLWLSKKGMRVEVDVEVDVERRMMMVMSKMKKKKKEAKAPYLLFPSCVRILLCYFSFIADKSGKKSEEENRKGSGGGEDERMMIRKRKEICSCVWVVRRIK